jgi:hypothetical protein
MNICKGISGLDVTPSVPLYKMLLQLANSCNGCNNILERLLPVRGVRWFVAEDGKA